MCGIGDDAMVGFQCDMLTETTVSLSRNFSFVRFNTVARLMSECKFCVFVFQLRGRMRRYPDKAEWHLCLLRVHAQIASS